MLQKFLQLQAGQTRLGQCPHGGRVHGLVHEDALCRVLGAACHGNGVALATVLAVDWVALLVLADMAKLDVGRDTGLQQHFCHLAQERVFGTIGHHAQHIAGVLAVRNGLHHRLVLGGAWAACGVGGVVQPHIAIISLARLNRLKQIIESLYHWAFFSRGQVGIALGILAQCLPLIEVADIGQEVIAIALQRHLVDNVILKTTRPALDDAAPIAIRSLVHGTRPLCHRGIVERLHQIGKRLLNLRAHAILVVWVALKASRFRILCQRLVCVVGESWQTLQPLAQLSAAHKVGVWGDWRFAPCRLRFVGNKIVLPVGVVVPSKCLLAAAHPAEIIVQRVKPLMRQRTRALRLGQVNHQAIWLKVRSCLA